MQTVINKTMDRADLETAEGRRVVDSINQLIRTLYDKQLYMTSWYGTLPNSKKRTITAWLKEFFDRTSVSNGVGVENRGQNYEPLQGAADDKRIPWYLYWEIYWVLTNGPNIQPSMKILDAGGTSSLFSCYLASLDCEVHSVDINSELVDNGNRISTAMEWKAFSYEMDMSQMQFPDSYFDHAYSICVFEHLDYRIKQGALREIARCLKPGGILSITFDYRNPAPIVMGVGPDTTEQNQLKHEQDVYRSFLSTPYFELVGNPKFVDNGKSYLVHPKHNGDPYTFGAVFLRKK